MIIQQQSRIIRFAVVGVTVAVFYFVLYLTFLSFGLPQLKANLMAFLFAIILQYVGQTMWTFRRPLAVPDQIGRFLITISLGLLVSSLITSALGPALGWENWLSAGIVTVVLPVQNYLFFKIWVFSGKNNNMEKP